MRAFISALVLVVATGCLKLSDPEKRFCDANPGKCEDGGATGGGLGGGTGGGGGEVDAGCEPGTLLPCYTDSASTLGVGICHGGNHTCQPDRSWSTTCGGEVVPQTEDCSTPADDDCDGTPLNASAGCVCIPGDAGTCFSVAAQKRNVGVCQDGHQICDPTGTSWGTCIGEIVDSVEVCGSQKDEDCNGVKDCAGEVVKGIAIPGSTNFAMVLSAVAAIPGGGAFVVGSFTGAPVVPTTPPTTLASAGQMDIVVMKVAPGGSIAWVKSFGGSLNDFATAATVDPNGNLVFGGSFTGSVSFGGSSALSTPDTSAPDGYIVWLDGAGNFVKQLQIQDNSGSTRQEVNGLAALPDAGIVATGDGYASIRIAGSQATLNASYLSGWVAIAGPAVPPIVPIGTNSGPSSGLAVAVDPSGDVHAVGQFSGSLSLPGVSAIDTYNLILDGYWAVLNGSTLGARLLVDIGETGTPTSTEANQIASSISVDSAGNAFIVVDQSYAGGPGGIVALNGCTVSTYDGIVKMNGATGACLWGQPMPPGANLSQVSVAIGQQPTIVGTFNQDQTDFGGGARSPVSSTPDGFLVDLLGSTGGHRFDQELGYTGQDVVTAVSFAPSSGWAIGTFTSASTKVNGVTLNGSANATNSFVIQLSGNE
ncbi:MAG: hypothetical protein ACJ790_14525 [Myxococcaceae bacterium]